MTRTTFWNFSSILKDGCMAATHFLLDNPSISESLLGILEKFQRSGLPMPSLFALPVSLTLVNDRIIQNREMIQTFLFRLSSIFSNRMVTLKESEINFFGSTRYNGVRLFIVSRRKVDQPSPLRSQWQFEPKILHVVGAKSAHRFGAKSTHRFFVCLLVYWCISHVRRILIFVIF